MILVEKNSYLLELCRYIVLNPVRAAMVRSAIDWPWSSYRATVGYQQGSNALNRDWVLADIASSRNEAIVLSYSSGGYGMKEIGDFFGLHYSRVSRIIREAKRKT